MKKLLIILSILFSFTCNAQKITILKELHKDTSYIFEVVYEKTVLSVPLTLQSLAQPSIMGKDTLGYIETTIYDTLLSKSANYYYLVTQKEIYFKKRRCWKNPHYHNYYKINE